MIKRILLIVFLLNFLSGCSHHYVAQPDDPRFAPTIPDVAETPIAKGGSIYIADTGLSLYQDIKAHRVGDIITIKLVEQTKASKDANTNTKKEFDVDLPNPTVMGNNPSFSLKKLLPFLNSRNEKTLASTAEYETEFKGSGNSGQNNSLTGDITVTVAQIFPNKNLMIRGEKWITLNQGSEYIRVSGIVRPEDVGPNNEVLSTRIANVRIAYSGTGALAQSNQAGWLARFFNSPIWPF